MSARRDRVHNLLAEGKSCAQVAALTGESPTYIARVERAERRAQLSAVIKAIGGKDGMVEIILVRGEGAQGKGLLIAPAYRNRDVDSLIECLKNLPPP